MAQLTSNLPFRGFEDAAKAHEEKVKREAEDQQVGILEIGDELFVLTKWLQKLLCNMLGNLLIQTCYCFKLSRYATDIVDNLIRRGICWDKISIE